MTSFTYVSYTCRAVEYSMTSKVGPFFLTVKKKKSEFFLQYQFFSNLSYEGKSDYKKSYFSDRGR